MPTTIYISVCAGQTRFRDEGVECKEEAGKDSEENEAYRFGTHVDIRMMKRFLFRRVILADGADRHFDTVDNGPQEFEQCPNRGDTDGSGTDKTYFLSPYGFSKCGGCLAFGRREDRCQIRNEDGPSQYCTD